MKPMERLFVSAVAMLDVSKLRLCVQPAAFAHIARFAAAYPCLNRGAPKHAEQMIISTARSSRLGSPASGRKRAERACGARVEGARHRGSALSRIRRSYSLVKQRTHRRLPRRLNQFSPSSIQARVTRPPCAPLPPVVRGWGGGVEVAGLP